MRTCKRCGDNIEELTKNARYCRQCSYINEYMPSVVKAEINKIWAALVKLQCNFWELEK